MATSRNSVTTALDLAGLGCLFVAAGVLVATWVGGVAGVAAALGVVGVLLLALSFAVSKVRE